MLKTLIFYHRVFISSIAEECLLSCFFESFSFAWIVTSWTTQLNLKIVIWLGVTIVVRILLAIWTWLSVSLLTDECQVCGRAATAKALSLWAMQYACVVVSMLHWFNKACSHFRLMIYRLCCSHFTISRVTRHLARKPLKSQSTLSHFVCVSVELSCHWCMWPHLAWGLLTSRKQGSLCATSIFLYW